MCVKQISIFIENKAGRLAEVTAILKNAHVNISALSLADTTDFGVLRMVVNHPDKAEKALKDEGFTVGITEVLAVEVSDEPGGLNKILDPLYENDINVEYMYALGNPKGPNSVTIFRLEDHDRALEIFKQLGIRVISAEEITHH